MTKKLIEGIKKITEMMWVLNVDYRNNKENRRTYILTVAGNGRIGRKETCGKGKEP